METSSDAVANLLLKMLRADEGTKLQVYDDASGRPIVPGTKVLGHPTIGTGRALDVNGITQEEADYLLTNDIAKVSAALDKRIPWWRSLTPNRQAVLASMAFQMGVDGLLGFVGTLAAVRAGNYSVAAERMLVSLWSRQTPARAGRLAEMMRKG